MKYNIAILVALLGALIVLFGYSLVARKQDQYISLDSNVNMQNVRQPAVAGSFYSDNKEKLSKDIDGFLNSAPVDQDKAPKVLTLPHAGYEYSGQVAAYGYKLLRNQNIKNVVILGSSHNFPIEGITADDSGSWETPLGEINVNRELINKLAIKKDSKPFVPEHSLEVQLPFLQRVLSEEFKITPILVGEMESEEMQDFASRLASNIDESTIVIVSSDMSHYPSYEDANKYDQETINSVLTGDVNKFTETLGQLEQKNIPNAVTFMCAQPAVELGMMLAKEIGAGDIKLLKYSNSGDSTGDKSRVVGYSAIGFFEKTADAAIKEKKLLEMARESVESFVKNGKIPDFEKYSKINQKSGVFVTLTNGSTLRGCIGLMESDQPIYRTLPHMAVAAAVNDPRFNPVTEEELPRLEYEVSILSPMKKIKDISEIKLGTHGVKVQNKNRSGVFLPQVAKENGWKLDEFMRKLCQTKAGLPADCWRDPSTEIYTFTAQVFSD